MYCLPGVKSVNVAVLVVTLVVCFSPVPVFNMAVYVSTRPETGTSHVTVNEVSSTVASMFRAAFGTKHRTNC